MVIPGLAEHHKVVVLVVVVLRMQVHLLGLLVKVMQVDEAAHPSVASMVAVAVVAGAAAGAARTSRGDGK